MSAKTFNTRFQLKYDTYENWSNKEKQFKLLQGEIAIVYIPETAGVDGVLHEPAVLFKVGDGTKTFNQLPFVSALAGDVPSWAKTTKRTNGEVISDDAFISALDEIDAIKSFFDGSGESALTFDVFVEKISALETASGSLREDLDQTAETLSEYVEKTSLIESDYLTSADKEELANGIGNFVEQQFTPLSNRINTFLESEEVEGVVDNLHEIQQWMNTSGKNVTDLTTAIANEKTEREEDILNLDKKIEELGDNFSNSVLTLQEDIINTSKEYTDEKIEELENSLVVDIDDLSQREEYIIFNCGSASTLISNPEDVNKPPVTTE